MQKLTVFGLKNSKTIRAFDLRISSFLRLLAVAVRVANLVAFTMVSGWHVTSEA